MKINKNSIFGNADEEMIPMAWHKNLLYHKDIENSWKQLLRRASEHEIEIKAISSFRNFESQKRIWNLKASGKKTLLDSQEQPIAFSNFNLNKSSQVKDLIFTILRWSALPGLSRHHWGSDLDIVDQRALSKNPTYKVQLVSSEYKRGGIFENLGSFLNEHLEQTDFFRPYRYDLGGIAPEPWHISHREVSQRFLNQLTVDEFLSFIKTQQEELIFRDVIVKSIDEIFRRFVYNFSL